MDKIAFDEIMDLAQYERVRPEFYDRVRKAKALRRIHLDELITVFFENKLTMHYQLQEMVRAERIVHEQPLREELATWNQLIPGRDELSVTLMIQETDMNKVRATLQRLKGIEDTISLVIDGERIQGVPEIRDVSPHMTAAVHYFRFGLSAAQREKALAGHAISMRIEHPEVELEKTFDPDTQHILQEDLRANL